MSWRSIEDALALGYGIERQFICHVHADTNASASVNAVTGLWVCYACGAKGKVNPDDVVISPSTVVREVNRALRIIEGQGHQYYPESWLSLFDGAGPGEYWLSRFTPEACKHYRLGHDSVAPAAVYPLRDASGRILGMVQRALSETGPKYHYPPGSDISQLLFGYHEAEADEIVLTEGATDAIAAWECGETPMALYGSRLSHAQKVLLRRYAPRRIWVATDQDAAGHAAADAVRRAFPQVDVRRLRWTGAKDLASVPLNERHALLAQSKEGRVASTSCGSSPRGPQLSRSSSTPRRLRIKRSES